MATDPAAKHADALAAQAVCCALLFSADHAEHEEDTADYLSQAQEHLQVAGHTDMAQDVAYSMKLAKHIHKASAYGTSRSL